MKLYQNIKELRIKRGLSQEELAEKTGYTSRSSIAKIESGGVDLSQTKILEFAKALNVSPSHLMGLDDGGDDTLSNPESNLLYLQDNPDLIPLFDAIHNRKELRMLLGDCVDLVSKDLEIVSLIVRGIKKERGYGSRS